MKRPMWCTVSHCNIVHRKRGPSLQDEHSTFRAQQVKGKGSQKSIDKQLIPNPIPRFIHDDRKAITPKRRQTPEENPTTTIQQKKKVSEPHSTASHSASQRKPCGVPLRPDAAKSARSAKCVAVRATSGQSRPCPP